MQLTNVLALFAFAAVAVAAPGKPVVVVPKPVAPAKPSPPVVNANSNTQINTCSSGSAYCCSPTGATNTGDSNDADTKAGTTCVLATTQCNTISICCNNVQQGTAPSAQTCSVANSLAQPVVFKVQN